MQETRKVYFLIKSTYNDRRQMRMVKHEWSKKEATNEFKHNDKIKIL